MILKKISDFYEAHETLCLMYHNNIFSVKYSGFVIEDYFKERDTVHIDVSDNNYFDLNLNGYVAEITEDGIELTKGEEQIILYGEGNEC